MLADADGMVMIGLSADAGHATAAVVEEIAAVLRPVAETEVGSAGDVTAGCAEWPMIPDRGVGRLGFAPGTGAASPPVMSWSGNGSGNGDDGLDDLVELLSGLPGHGIRARLRALGVGPHIAHRRWETQVIVVTTGQRPGLRLRAALRRRFPGMVVSRSAANAPMWLQINDIDLARVLAVPVCGTKPLAGVCTAPSAAIPVLPVRSGVEADADPALGIGHAVTAGGRTVVVALTESERLRHVHVLGRTGTGKSSLLAAIAGGIAAGDGGAFVADPHGLLCDRILAEVPDAARDRLWVIRCADLDHPVPMNPLAETDLVRRDIAINEVCASFQYLFDKRATGIVGPRFSERVAMALRALSAVHGPRTSLLDVPVVLADDDFMDDAVKISGDERVIAWWRNDKNARRSSDHGEVVSWVNCKFEAFAATAAMRAILGSGVDAVDFAAMMDAGRIILVDLSKAQLGDAASRLLGYLYLSRLWSGALRRKDSGRPFTVIVDEAHSLISGALTSMLAEGRKFGLSVVLAHQYLEQLDEDLRPAVDGNAATTIAFRCAVSDATELAKRFAGLVDPSVLMTLPDLSAVCQRSAMRGFSQPHTLVVDHNARTAGRTGMDLDAHASAVMDATRAALVDPHRDLTTAAARGASNVATIRPAGQLRTAPAAATDAAVGGRGSFLDEWLKRREQQADSAEVSP